MAYAPDPYDATRPLGSDIAQTAALEFRTVKAFYVGSVGRNTTLFQLTNSAASTAVSTITIPAGSLDNNKKLRYQILGQVTNVTGANRTISMSCYYGVSLLASGVMTSLSSADPAAFRYELEFGNRFATNSQFANSRAELYYPDAGGALVQIVPSYPMGSSRTGIAEDSTLAKDFNCYFVLSIASPLFTVTVDSAIIEII